MTLSKNHANKQYELSRGQIPHILKSGTIWKLSASRFGRFNPGKSSRCRVNKSLHGPQRRTEFCGEFLSRQKSNLIPQSLNS
jgi:hypothetical protein